MRWAGGEGSWDRRERERAETRNDSGLPSTPLTVLIGLEAATVRIRAYRATGEVDIQAFTQGTRHLLTCDVIELPEDREVVSYRWYQSLTGENNDRYQIYDGDPYYRVVKNTLLIDVTSLDQGGKYSCFVRFTNNAPQSSDSTAIITVEG